MTSFGLRPGFNSYWFFGYHARDGVWYADAAVGHITDVYSNGILTTVYYDDDASDLDMNDFVIQIFTTTGGIRPLKLPPLQAEINGKFEKDVLPRLQKS